MRSGSAGRRGARRSSMSALAASMTTVAPRGTSISSSSPSEPAVRPVVEDAVADSSAPRGCPRRVRVRGDVSRSPSVSWIRTTDPVDAAEPRVAVARSRIARRPVGPISCSSSTPVVEPRHRVVLPRARIAVAASSALISWRASASRIAGAVHGRVGGRGGRFGRGVVELLGVGTLPEAEGADEGLDAGADGRVADAELALHLAQVAAGAEEALEQRELVAVQAAEPPDAEVAFERGPAAAAVEAGDRELARADGTGGDDVVWHWIGSFLVSVVLVVVLAFTLSIVIFTLRNFVVLSCVAQRRPAARTGRAGVVMRPCGDRARLSGSEAGVRPLGSRRPGSQTAGQ